MDNQSLLQYIGRFSAFTDPMIERGSADNRRGLFAVRVRNSEGKPMAGIPVHAELARHEFKFGCALFLLDQFHDDRRNQLYREEFAHLFNYGVLPLYWDTLEPQRGNPRFSVDSEDI